MQLSKKDKVMMGIAGGLLVIVIIVYAIYYGGGEKSDPINPADYSKGGGGMMGKPPAKKAPETPTP